MLFPVFHCLLFHALSGIHYSWVTNHHKENTTLFSNSISISSFKLWHLHFVPKSQPSTWDLTPSVSPLVFQFPSPNLQVTKIMFQVSFGSLSPPMWICVRGEQLVCLTYFGKLADASSVHTPRTEHTFQMTIHYKAYNAYHPPPFIKELHPATSYLICLFLQEVVTWFQTPVVHHGLFFLVCEVRNVVHIHN